MKKKLFILGFLVLGVSFQGLNALSRSERKKIVEEAQKIVKDVLGQKSFKSTTDRSGRVTQHDISDSSNSASIQDTLNRELKDFLNKQKSTDAAEAAVDALKKALAKQIKKDKKAGVEKPEVAQEIFETALGAQIANEAIDHPDVWSHSVEVAQLGSTKSQAQKIVKDALATEFNAGEKFHGTLHSIMLGGDREDKERRERVQEAIKALLDQQTTLEDAKGAVKALETALKKQMARDSVRGVVLPYSVEGLFESFIETALQEKATDEGEEGIWNTVLTDYKKEKATRDAQREADRKAHQEAIQKAAEEAEQKRKEAEEKAAREAAEREMNKTAKQKAKDIIDETLSSTGEFNSKDAERDIKWLLLDSEKTKTTKDAQDVIKTIQKEFKRKLKELNMTDDQKNALEQKVYDALTQAVNEAQPLNEAGVAGEKTGTAIDWSELSTDLTKAKTAFEKKVNDAKARAEKKAEAAKKKAEAAEEKRRAREEEKQKKAEEAAKKKAEAEARREANKSTKTKIQDAVDANVDTVDVGDQQGLKADNDALKASMEVLLKDAKTVKAAEKIVKMFKAALEKRLNGLDYDFGNAETSIKSFNKVADRVLEMAQLRIKNPEAAKVIDSLNFQEMKGGKFGADKALQAFLEKAETPQEAQKRIEALKDLLTQEGRTEDLATLDKAVGQMLEARYRLEAAQARRDQETPEGEKHPEQGDRVLADGTQVKYKVATEAELEAWLDLAGTYDPEFKAKIEAEKQSSSSANGLFGGDGPVDHMTAAEAAEAERKAHEQGDQAGKTGKSIETDQARAGEGHVIPTIHITEHHNDPDNDPDQYGFGDEHHDATGGTGSSTGDGPSDGWIEQHEGGEHRVQHQDDPTPDQDEPDGE